MTNSQPTTQPMPEKRPAQRGDTPADKAYTNDRRAGRTQPGKIEDRSRDLTFPLLSRFTPR